MHLECPQCKYSREIPDEKIPAKAQMATCPKCGHKFQFRELDFTREAFTFASENQTPEDSSSKDQDQKQDQKQENDIWSKLESLGPQETENSSTETGSSSDKKTSARSKQEVPWEHLEKYGFFPGLSQTIHKVLFSPAFFFRHMPLGQGKIMPLVFYLLVSEVQALAQFFWQMTGILSVPEMSGKFGGMLGLGMTGIGSLFILIFYPVLLTIMLFLISGINHFCLNILRAASGGFEGTFRVLSYSSAPMVFSVIPVLGPLIGVIWTFICTIIGFKNMHRTTTLKVVLAMLIAGFIFLLINMPLLLMNANQV